MSFICIKRLLVVSDVFQRNGMIEVYVAEGSMLNNRLVSDHFVAALMGVVSCDYWLLRLALQPVAFRSVSKFLVLLTTCLS